ncbi:O-methyltransferase [Oxalobacteraceae bacterium A2-2]
MTILALLLAAASLLTGLYVLHKVRLAHLLLHQLRDRSSAEPAILFRQLEALLGLYAELRLPASLPPTRGWAASPDLLLALARHARDQQPRSVLECSSGVSTLVLARCMQQNGSGKVVSLEHDAGYADRTRELLRRHGLSDWAEVLHAPLRPHLLHGEAWSWYDLDGLALSGPIDMLVVDGPPQAVRRMARYPAGPLLLPKLAPDGWVFLDDAERADEQAMLARWRLEFPVLRQGTLPCEKGCAVLSAVLPDAQPA